MRVTRWCMEAVVPTHATVLMHVHDAGVATVSHAVPHRCFRALVGALPVEAVQAINASTTPTPDDLQRTMMVHEEDVALTKQSVTWHVARWELLACYR